jgi:hypothetical protein
VLRWLVRRAFPAIDFLSRVSAPCPARPATTSEIGGAAETRTLTRLRHPLPSGG